MSPREALSSPGLDKRGLSCNLSPAGRKMATSIFFRSTNNPAERVGSSRTAQGLRRPTYGLYTVARADIPRIGPGRIRAMPDMSYGEIAFQVLHPYLASRSRTATSLSSSTMRTGPTRFRPKSSALTKTRISCGSRKRPTYSFKDYAARFFGRVLDYFLVRRGLRRVVVVATSGDTGGAVADALCGLAERG